MAGGSSDRMSATVTACAAVFFVPFAGWMLLGASDTWSATVAGGVASTLVTGTAPTMADLSLPDRVFAALDQRNLKPAALTVEMTEELPMGRFGPTKSVLGELRHRGVRISIDDFGAGYPALSYLCHLPIDEIKLDRDFIGPHMSSSRVESVVRAAVTMVRELGLTVVAEGVGDADAAARLMTWGFDVAQGDFFGAATPAAGVPALTMARPTHRGVAR